MRKNRKKVNSKVSLVIIFILLNIIGKAQLPPSCVGADTTHPSFQMGLLPSSCDTAFTGTSYKYKLQSTYVPALTDPLITVKLVVHILIPTDTSLNVWTNGPRHFRGMTALQNFFARIQSQQERYSQARSVSYTTPGPYPLALYDSRIQYEVVKYYFYTSNVYYYGTANGLPSAPATINGAPNPAANPRIYFTSHFMDYINQTYPARFDEGLPIIIGTDGGFARTYNATIPGSIPFISIGHFIGTDSTSEVYSNNFMVRHVKHELGHCFGFLHPYYGAPCYPSDGSDFPETRDPNTKSLDCNNTDYLSDLFPANNPLAVSASFPSLLSTCPGPPINSCNSLYENGDNSSLGINSNNMMSENTWNNLANGGVYDWISPLQMGRRIRSMHFKSDAFSWKGIANWGNIRHFAKDARSEHTYPLNITTNETWSFDVQMYKDIFVRKGNTLTIKCKVAMATDGRIIVEQGAKLVIDGGEVTGWCKKTPDYSYYNMPLWFGIEVWGNTNMSQLINNTTGYCPDQGIVEIKNGGTLSYARNAIYTGYAMYNVLYTSGFSGGIVIANNAKFVNNVFDILFFKYQIGTVRSKLVNCQFITNDTIGRDGNGNMIVPQEHVKLYQNSGLYFENCTFENQTNFYVNSTAGIGISSTDSHFNVGFNNALGSTPATKCYFKKLGIGVLIDNTNPLYSAKIKNSNFYRNDFYGIRASNSNYMVLSEDSFDIRFSQVGAYLYQSKYYKVKNNEFYSSNTRMSTTGLAIYSSGNGAHEVYRNNFSKMGYAIISMDNNGGIGSGQAGLKMNCNNFFKSNSLNGWDIALTKSGSIMPSIYPNQSTSGSSGNSLVRNQYGAVNLGAAYINKYFVDSSNTQSINHACNINAVTNPNLPNQRASSQVNVLPTTIVFDYQNHCLAYPSSSGGSSGTANQKLAAMNSYIAELRANNSEGENDFEIQSTVSSKMSLFLTDSIEGGQDSVINILATNQGNMDDADIQLIFAFMKKGDYASAINRKNGLPSSREAWKNLFNTIIPIEQDTMAAFSIVNNTSTINVLNAYANNEAGDGQACARAYLRFALGSEFNFPLVYPDGGNGSRLMSPVTEREVNLSIVNSPYIKVYPNPAQTGITVFYTGEKRENITVEVKDLLGRIIYTNFMKWHSEGYISLLDLNNGVYLLTVKDTDKEIIFQSKLIKQD